MQTLFTLLPLVEHISWMKEEILTRADDALFLNQVHLKTKIQTT